MPQLWQYDILAHGQLNAQILDNFQFFLMRIFFFNPKTVGMDSGVQFSLSNFLEDILQPTSAKTSPKVPRKFSKIPFSRTAY